MSIELCVLASGSSGNCSLVRTPGGVMLIDCGIGPRTFARRLNGTGVRMADVRAICVTHLDSDHFSSSWARTIIAQGILIHCHASCVSKLLGIVKNDGIAELLRPFDDEFDPLPDVRARPVTLTHDEAGSFGFVLEGLGSRLGYATDLGHVPDPLVEEFADLDVLAIESNYDPMMQEQSPRPFFLKRRIMGGKGHLSNEQALQAVRRILDRAQRRAAMLPAHIVLLHRSRQCNCPKLLKKLFCSDARIAPRLVLAEPFTRTEWLCAPGRRIATGEQLLLSWG